MNIAWSSDVGGHHLVFYVTGLLAAVAYLKQLGVKVFGEPATLTDGPNAGLTWVHFLAPSGDATRASSKIASCGPDTPVATMSGGNQQKAIVARWARTCRNVLILDEPTRGVDVGAKTEIYRIMHELASQGKQAFLDMMKEKHPRCLGEPVDVANYVLFLASDEARFVTGASLVVDGYTAQ